MFDLLSIGGYAGESCDQNQACEPGIQRFCEVGLCMRDQNRPYRRLQEIKCCFATVLLPFYWSSCARHQISRFGSCQTWSIFTWNNFSNLDLAFRDKSGRVSSSGLITSTDRISLKLRSNYIDTRRQTSSQQVRIKLHFAENSYLHRPESDNLCNFRPKLFCAIRFHG